MVIKVLDIHIHVVKGATIDIEIIKGNYRGKKFTIPMKVLVYAFMSRGTIIPSDSVLRSNSKVIQAELFKCQS